MTNELVEIFPYGVTLSADQARPVMLFKDDTESKVLPVWLSALDAGISVYQNSVEMGHSTSPYNLTWKILKPLGVYLEKCCFTEVKGLHQYVELHFKGHPKLTVLKSRADEAVSFCLSNKTQFFCEADFFDKCRIVESEIANMGSSAQKNFQKYKNSHQYMN